MSSANPDDRISSTPRRTPSPPPLPSLTSREPESLPSLAGGGGGGLSSLAQAAREKQLRNARNTMIAIGILTILFQVGMAFLYRTQINDEMRKAGLDPNNLPPQVRTAVMIDYGVIGLFAMLGVVFIVLAVMVRRFPVPCTVTGLVLYVLSFLAAVALNPANIAAGIIVKIIIVVALVKAVQAALAYERDRREAEESLLDAN